MEKALYESERDVWHRNVEFFGTGGCAPHFHAQVEILSVVAGSIEVTVNGVTQTVHAGGLCVSGSYDVHSYTLGEGGEGFVFLIPTGYLQKFFACTKDRVLTSHIIYDAETVRLYGEFADIYRRCEKHNQLFEEGWVNAVLGIVYDGLEFSQVTHGGKNDTIREVLTYIREHYEEDLTLEGLSKRFGYNPYHFSRIFNGYTNISLKRYINSVRFEAVADKLRRGESVTQAALDSGFNSMRTFYRGFTEYYGLTPQRYVKSYAIGGGEE